jgi:DNA repair protein RadC
LLRPFFEGAEEERVAVLHLGPDRQVIGLTREGAGGRGDVELPVGAIVASALRLGAAAIIVAHNHPSGDPSPSAEDVAATRMLAEAASAVGVRLVDHLVVAGEELRSFAGLGLL